MYDLPSWIHAAAATVLAVVTTWTLIVLRRYAADTKKIAESSVEQVSASLAQAAASAEQARASIDQAKASNEQAKISAQQLEDTQTPLSGSFWHPAR